MKRKVLMVTGSACGGAERMTVLYAKLLMSAGWDVTLLLHRFEEGDNVTLRNFIPEGMRTLETVCRFRNVPLRLFKAVKAEKPSVVFCSMPDFSAVCISLKRLFFHRLKVIVREINTPSRHPEALRKRCSFFYPKADALVSQTEEMAEGMVRCYGLSPQSVTTINNPTDCSFVDSGLSSPSALDSDFTNFVAIGRVDPQKDYMTLLKAFRNVAGAIDNARLTIVGGFPDKSYLSILKEKAGEYGLSENIVFAGFQSNPYAYLNGADCFVLSSEYEGLPNVLLDAIYAGVPVAATSCIPFIRQAVREGLDGFTCEVGDADGLASAMIRAASLEIASGRDATAGESAKVVELFNKVTGI